MKTVETYFYITVEGENVKSESKQYRVGGICPGVTFNFWI